MSLVERVADKLKLIRARKLSRCAKACFMDKDGALTLEGERLLADLRTHSGLFETIIRRDGSGAIDKDQLLRMEGRRELVLRLLNLLELDPLGIARLREVDDA